MIQTVSDSGLRGRGGAGFPTGLKWALARQQPGGDKYVICNGDEGDPGAFMDRLVLESDPHRVLEGLAIAAYAIGAAEGIFYIRAEYPLAVERVREAIRQAEQRGFLGRGMLGSEFSLRLEVREGAGAFVCGEETALIQSLEGRRGMPRLRPPYPVERGFRGRPTLHQQRRDAGLRALDRAPRRRRLRRARHRKPARAPRSSRWPARSTAAA